VCSNCKPDVLDDRFVINVENDFYIDMFEDISNGDKVFHITIKSIQQQNCLNSIIDYELNTDDENQIILSINDIIDPETCDPGTAQAFISIPIEDIKEQFYNIQIKLKEIVTNQGNLIVNEDIYVLNMNSEDGIEVVHEKLNKIPQKTIWGYLAYAEEGKKTEAESIIKELDDITTSISLVPGYDAGYFGYFTLLEGQSILMSDEVEESFHSTFIFNYNSDYQDITQFITESCSSHFGFNFYLFNDEGEELVCP